jgi:hypothetical protein
MPVKLDLQEEEYAPTGGIGGEGVLKALGRPQMGVLTLLTREALQNSWDARLSPHGPIDFMVHAWTLKPSELRAARQYAFRDIPESLPLGRELQRPTVNALCISDRGTRGLVGPTRADKLEIGDENRNFVAFVRDVGRAASAHVDGGTYGYGKASYYQASRAGTICIHTRIRAERGRFEDRFIAAGLGEQHNAVTGRKRVRRTGRCWWGQLADDGVVDPIAGEEARLLAAALGMPEFDGGATGTSILVISPELSVDTDGERTERSLRQAVTRFVNDLIWCAWPKMIPGRSGVAPITFHAGIRENRGIEKIGFPDVTKFAPISAFVETYRFAVRSMHDNRMADPGCLPIKRYRDTIGWLSLKKFGIHERQSLDTGDADSPAWVGTPSHHVALMRGPRLIVRYVDGAPLQTDVAEYAGVFISQEHVEEAFASAEPPTHDDWRPETLSDPLQKSQVRVALQKIREEMNRFAGGLGSPGAGDGSVQALGGFSELLGGLLTQVEGTGRADIPPPKPPPPGGGGGGRPRVPRASVRLTGEVEHVLSDGRRAARLSFLVSPAPNTHHTAVRAAPRVAVGDGDQIENDPPAGADLPKVIAWLTPNGKVLAQNEQVVRIPAYEVGVWKVDISVPDEALVSVDLRVD